MELPPDLHEYNDANSREIETKKMTMPKDGSKDSNNDDNDNNIDDDDDNDNNDDDDDNDTTQMNG